MSKALQVCCHWNIRVGTRIRGPAKVVECIRQIESSHFAAELPVFLEPEFGTRCRMHSSDRYLIVFPSVHVPSNEGSLGAPSKIHTFCSTYRKPIFEQRALERNTAMRRVGLLYRKQRAPTRNNQTCKGSGPSFGISHSNKREYSACAFAYSRPRTLCS